MLEVNSITAAQDRTHVIMKLTTGEEVRVPTGYIMHAAQLLKSPPRISPVTLCEPCNKSTWKPNKDERTEEPGTDAGSPGTPESN